jgi:hypothetical protein
MPSLLSLIRRQPLPPEPEPIPEITNELHALSDNYPMTASQYDRTVTYAGALQRLYDQAGAYIASAGLAPEVALPGNEGAEWVPARGLQLRSPSQT